MKAGQTDIEVGTKIRTTTSWDKTIITGTIAHPFGYFGGNPQVVAGIRIDKKFQDRFLGIGNLYAGDFEVVV